MRRKLGSEAVARCCFLLTSKSYLEGSLRDNSHGTGPWWINFEPTLPSAIREVDLIKRINGSILDFDSFVEFGIPVLSEVDEIDVDITTDQEDFGYDVSSLIREIYATGDSSTLEFEIYEAPSPAPSEESYT